MGLSMQIDWHCVCGDGEGSHRSTAEGEQCWGHCQKTDRDCAGLGYRPIEHTWRPPAFAAILQTAIDRRQPEHYTCDLSTDYQALKFYQGRFIWICRSMGTHLYLLDWQMSDEARDWTRDYTVSALKYHAREASAQQAQAYYWDGSTLVATDMSTAVLIAEQSGPPEPRCLCGHVEEQHEDDDGPFCMECETLYDEHRHRFQPELQVPA